MTAISLYPRQQEALRFVAARGGRAGLFCDMGSGKTRMALAATVPEVRRTLVVAPLSVVRVWEREIAKLGIDADTVLVLPDHGALRQQAAALAAWTRAGRDGIVLTHYDVFWRGALGAAVRAYQPEALIADEAHRLKHHTTKRTKFALALAASPATTHRLVLTGTPTDARLDKAFVHTRLEQARLTNLFSLLQVVDPTVLGTSWGQFQARYCILRPLPVPHVVGYQRVPELEERTRTAAHFLYKHEIGELPPCVDVEVPVDLLPATRRLYSTLQQQALVEVTGRGEDGAPHHGTALARITLVEALKLQQLAAGSVITDQGVVDCSAEKLEACRDLVSDAITGTNVVVVARFGRNIRRLVETLATLPDVTVVTLQGTQTKADRDAALTTFETQDRVILVAQVQAGALGLDLTRANVMVVFTPDFDLANFTQLHARLDRPGQTRRVTVFHLLARNTVDERIYRALRAGMDLTQRTQGVAFARQLLG